jgi:hypothetical protein
MDEEFTNDSWRGALALYDSLVGPQWQHIRRFRELVAAIGRCSEASGLTAVTSHETLMISPYTCYPDWFDGRHVRLHPMPNGTVRVYKFPEQPNRHPAETWTVPLDEAEGMIRRLLTEL